MIHLTDRLAEAVADSSAPVEAADRADLGELLPLVQHEAAAQDLALDDDRLLAVAVHCLAFARRVRGGEHLDPLGVELYTEVPAERLAAARHLIDTYCAPRGYTAPDSEALLLALHFEVARRTADAHENRT